MEYNKIAIISDLHANLYMLDTFLNYVEKKKIELVINLGDFVSEGPYPCEVVEKVLKDKRFINIRGYDEDKILEGNVQEEGVGTLEWAREKLSLDLQEKIRQLPSIKSIELGNMKILMMHLNGFAEISQKIAHSNRKIISGEYYDYIFCGGGHLQQLIHVKEPFFNTNIIEPGALMKDKNDRGHFVVLEIKDIPGAIAFITGILGHNNKNISMISTNKPAKSEYTFLTIETEDELESSLIEQLRKFEVVAKVVVLDKF